MELLALTWFFSSLYMVALYLALFISPLRSGAVPRDRYPWGDHFSRAGCGTALYLAQLIGMVILTAYSGG